LIIQLPACFRITLSIHYLFFHIALPGSMPIPEFNRCFDLIQPLPEPSIRRRPSPESPIAVAATAQDTKMSHLFKQLTLNVAAHFVNSLPPVMARLEKQWRRLQRGLAPGQPVHGPSTRGHGN
jgi:hypothetical protein